jgi:uncharacterized protein (TIGR03032 family)
VRYCTGMLDAHDLGVGSDGPWVVATHYNSLVRLSDRFSFVPDWQPPFVSAAEQWAEDCCHLNGLAMIDGRPMYATALGTSDKAGGWRSNKLSGGVLVSIPDNAVRLGGLCMPHSPRWHNGSLWLLNSGLGELWKVDPSTGNHEAVCTLPGYLRGLGFVGRFALVGMSTIREEYLLSGLPVLARFNKLKCGVTVVDVQTGETLGALEFTAGCREVFDVGWLPGVRRPMLLNPEHPAQSGAVTTPSFSGWRREGPRRGRS